jgi:hypothetical protein
VIRWSQALLPAAAPLLLAAGGYEAVPVSNIIQPAEPALDPADEMTLIPGDAIFKQAVVAAPGAVLAEPVTLSIAGVDGVFPAGKQLQTMTLTAKASTGLSKAAGIYCARPSDSPSPGSIRLLRP